MSRCPCVATIRPRPREYARFNNLAQKSQVIFRVILVVLVQVRSVHNSIQQYVAASHVLTPLTSQFVHIFDEEEAREADCIPGKARV